MPRTYPANKHLPSPNAPQRTSPYMGLKILAIVAEVVLIAFAVAGSRWEPLLLGHLGVVLCLLIGIVTLEHKGINSGGMQRLALLTFAGGPIGGLTSLLGEHQVMQTRADILENWYDTIAPRATDAVTLVDKIIDGRLVRADSQLPRPFAELLQTGSMEEKQALLAYLAAAGNESVTQAALELALRSPDHRLRVQAAAVAAHTRARRRGQSAGASSPLGALVPGAEGSRFADGTI
jgi:hypothetical protein